MYLVEKKKKKRVPEDVWVCIRKKERTKNILHNSAGRLYRETAP